MEVPVKASACCLVKGIQQVKKKSSCHGRYSGRESSVLSLLFGSKYLSDGLHAEYGHVYIANKIVRWELVIHAFCCLLYGTAKCASK